MSNIRRQSIISSFIVYAGFALGFLNTYLFTKEGGFTKSQYGLTNTFIAVATIMFSIASVGMHSYILKFYPYYKDNLPDRKNDQLTWSLLFSLGGFALVAFLGIAGRGVVDKIFANQPLFLSYYYWIFPFALGLTVFSILEAYAWQHHRSVVTNYLREVQFRFFVTILILLVTYGLIETFDLFVKLYAFTFPALALILFIYLWRTGRIHFTFSRSHVSKKFYRKIVMLVSFVWTGGLIFNLSYVFDTIVLTAVLSNGLEIAGIFTLGQYMTSLIQAPQRAVITASVAPLSQAWKNKDLGKIRRIYMRSSINQLLFSVGMFALIWMNFRDGILTFNIQKDFLLAADVFFLMGIMRIIDMGTGVNAQIISTSVYWRFEFITGLILLGISLPLNYILTRQLGLTGPAIANLVSFTVYNFIRYMFLLRKFNMQPFTIKSLYAILVAAVAYFVCYFLFKDESGLIWMIIRSVVFLILFIPAVILLKISPDVLPVWEAAKSRLFSKRG